jgi:hypothetical protein
MWNEKCFHESSEASQTHTDPKLLGGKARKPKRNETFYRTGNGSRRFSYLYSIL